MRQEQDFPWDTKERGMILSAFFIGYLTTQFVGGLYGARIGGNLVIELYGIQNCERDIILQSVILIITER